MMPMTVRNPLDRASGARRFARGFLLMAVAFTLISVTSSPAASPWSSTASFPPYAKEEQIKPHVVTASTPDRDAALRTYTLHSTIEQREGGPSERVFAEQANRSRVRSGSVLFDALFAMALDDATLNSVREIHDVAYDAGRAIACDCFETGEKWTYVWTRDLAYAADLGLADLDPQRVMSSLLFKASSFRDGVRMPASLPAGSLQIIQDTGSGGSWPVSTDRVAWALGAEAVLANLPAEPRKRFASTVYAALLGTVEADREAAFDGRSGLYGGEQSFLDWRDQTYAPWIVDDLSHMAQSRALSTNVVHYRALRLAARLARQKGEVDRAGKYDQWAADLQRAINDRFWLEDVKLYASLITSDLHAAPVRKFDMLGTALAIVSGVAPPERAREALSRYPHAPFGVPVYFPQQPDTFVYHNRAIWPFVSAYALKAAARTRNAAVASHAVESLMRAAALNLSNMENLEWLTGRAQYDNGPQINSRRQLWSVGAYLGMVTETIFGYHVTDDGVVIAPFLTTGVRRALGDADTATLSGLSYLGRPINITLKLPRGANEQGYYAIASLTLNGRVVDGPITDRDLATSANDIKATFARTPVRDDRITSIPLVAALSHTDPRVFSPRTPTVSVEVGKEAAPSLHIETDLDQEKDKQLDKTPNGCAYCDGFVTTLGSLGINAVVPFPSGGYGAGTIGATNRWPALDPNRLFEAAILARGQAYWDANLAPVPELRSSSNVQETITGAYLQADFAGESWNGNVGVRYVSTEDTSSGHTQQLLALVPIPGSQNFQPTFSDVVPVSYDTDYDNWLPSANFTYRFADNLQLRASASKAITRPSFTNLGVDVNYEVNSPPPRLTRNGNPFLEPIEADSYDLSLEWYGDGGSSASAALFYKDISNFVTTAVVVEEIVGYEMSVTQPINGDTAQLMGVELAVQQLWESGWGVQANYTYVDNDAKLTIENEKVDTKLDGVSGNTVNLSGFYEKNGSSARLSYVYRDDFIDCGVCGPRLTPRTTAESAFLDFSGSYDVNDMLTIYLDVQNLTEEETHNYYSDERFTHYYEQFPRRYEAGVRVKF